MAAPSTSSTPLLHVVTTTCTAQASGDRPHYKLTFVPVGHTLFETLAYLFRGERFIGTQLVLVAMESDLPKLWRGIYCNAVLRVRSDGTLVEGAQAMHDQLVSGDGTERVAYVMSGGSVAQSWCLARLAREDGGAFRDAFDVQEEGVVQLKS